MDADAWIELAFAATVALLILYLIATLCLTIYRQAQALTGERK